MDDRYHLRPTEGDSGNFFTSLLTIGQIYSLIVRDYKFDIEWLLSSHKEFPEPHIRINIRATMNNIETSNESNLPLRVADGNGDEQHVWDAVGEDPSVIQPPHFSIVGCIKVNGLIDIIMHPVYNIPSPFMRFFDDSGAVFDSLQTETICRACRSLSPEQPREILGIRDHRYNEFGRVILDNHPFFGTPFYSLHVCHASQLLSVSSSLCQQHSYAQQQNEVVNRPGAVAAERPPCPSRQSGLMDALNWLSLFGPHIGLPFSPSIYSQIFHIINNQPP